MRAIPLIAVLLCISMPSIADIHIVKRIRRFSKQSSETISYTVDTWIAHDREYRAGNHTVRIKRYDLNRHWYIDNRTKTFIEWFLVESAEQERQEDLHNEGFIYEPEYDWEIRDGGKAKVIGGIQCKQFILDGDADFADKVIELWVADSLPVGEQYREALLGHFAQSETHSIMAMFPRLRGAFIVSERTTTKLPVIARFSVESKIVYLEEAEPPPRIYELPKDVQRALTRDY